MWSLLLPQRCPVCERPGCAPCADCWRRLEPAPLIVPLPAGVDRCRALLRYDGPGRELLVRLKYRNSRGAVAWLAAGMAQLAVQERLDVVTWAPTTAGRRRQRGFDQAQLLARAVARVLDVPARPLLVRRPGPAQTGRSRAQRLAGPCFAPGRRLAGSERVLLVDDVITTGATVEAAASALRGAGAVYVAVVAAGCTALKVAQAPADA